MLIRSSSGLITCSRYAFAPNYFHYCGPEKQKDLLGYVKEHISDKGLTEIISDFETLYPYLVLIASQNNIKDPFDLRVVEAYWLGNDLLKNVKLKAFGDHLSDTLLLKKKMKGKDFSPMMEHIITGVPQHNFHVMNIFIRTGHASIVHTLSTMDNCRISWGKVIDLGIVETQSLEYIQGTLALGKPVAKSVTSVGVKPKIGDWVSMHWGFVCDILTCEQLSNLKRSTMHVIRFANTTSRQI
jgi:hydrogenase maturation factor